MSACGGATNRESCAQSVPSRCQFPRNQYSFAVTGDSVHHAHEVTHHWAGQNESRAVNIAPNYTGSATAARASEPAAEYDRRDGCHDLKWPRQRSAKHGSGELDGETGTILRLRQQCGMKILPRRGGCRNSFSDLAVFAVKFFFAAKQSGEIPAGQFFRRIAQQPVKAALHDTNSPSRSAQKKAFSAGSARATKLRDELDSWYCPGLVPTLGISAFCA